MLIRLTIKIGQGQKVRNMKDMSTGQEFMRTSTKMPNPIVAPINLPPNFTEVEYVSEQETVVTLDALQTIYDLDGNPYAPYYIEP